MLDGAPLCRLPTPLAPAAGVLGNFGTFQGSSVKPRGACARMGPLNGPKAGAEDARDDRSREGTGRASSRASAATRSMLTSEGSVF